MNLGEQVVDYVLAGFSGIWVKSRDPRAALAQIADRCVEADIIVHDWSPLGQWRTGAERGWMIRDGHFMLQDALETFRAEPQPTGTYEQPDGTAATHRQPGVFVIRGAARAIRGNEVLQELLGQMIAEGSREGVAKSYVILVEDDDPPKAIEQSLLPLTHNLPDLNELDTVLSGVVPEEEQPVGEVRREVLKAAAGLSVYLAEGAFALSVAEKGEMDPVVIRRVKAQLLNRGGGALKVLDDDIGFDQVGGLSALKDYAVTVLSRNVTAHQRPRGLLLLGVPGTGKSLFVKALGKAVGRPVLQFDVGLTQSKYVGESERQLETVLEQARMMAPCVFYISEVEKALAGAGSDSSGVKTGILGRLLDFMQDTAEEVYTILTCNDIHKILRTNPEFGRKGRIDRMYFLDFPSAAARQEIWKIHLTNFGFVEPGQDIPGDMALPPDDKWTGAEIEACVREAWLLGRPLAEVGRNIVGIAKVSETELNAVREWASGRCYSPEVEGLFQKDAAPVVPAAARRRPASTTRTNLKRAQ